MSKLRSRLKSAMRKSLLMFAALATAGQLSAQTARNLQGSSVSDPFVGMHNALSSAADNLLAAAAAQRLPGPPVIATLPGQPAGAVALNTSNSSDSWDRALQRVKQLRPLIEPILREHGVPAELAAVVLVESGGQPAALSPKGARGIWQLMPDTARRYGLLVTTVQDDRTDPERSTHAAARYLRDLYAQFGNWSLALAAYNAGELRVETAISRTGAADFGRLSKDGRIPSETRNYVPAVWTAVERLGNRSSLLPNRKTSRTARVVYPLAQAPN